MINYMINYMKTYYIIIYTHWLISRITSIYDFDSVHIDFKPQIYPTGVVFYYVTMCFWAVGVLGISKTSQAVVFDFHKQQTIVGTIWSNALKDFGSYVGTAVVVNQSIKQGILRLH